MRIELTAPTGEWYPVSSPDPAVLDAWMSSMMPLIMGSSADTNMYWRITVYSEFMDRLPQNFILPNRQRLLDADGALQMAGTFARLATALREREAENETEQQAAREDSKAGETPTPPATASNG